MPFDKCSKDRSEINFSAISTWLVILLPYVLQTCVKTDHLQGKELIARSFQCTWLYLGQHIVGKVAVKKNYVNQDKSKVDLKTGLRGVDGNKKTYRLRSVHLILYSMQWYSAEQIFDLDKKRFFYDFFKNRSTRCEWWTKMAANLNLFKTSKKDCILFKSNFSF